MLGADGRQAADGDGFSLHGNTKTIEGRQHPDRDQQFRYINEQVTAFQATGRSSDLGGHEKEGAGRQLRRRRQEWERSGPPRKVNHHDFPDKELGKVAPYGVYDLTANAGWVNVGPAPTPPSSRSSRSAAGGI